MFSPEEAIDNSGLKKLWVSRQMVLPDPSVLSRLLKPGEARDPWTEDLKLRFAAAVGLSVQSIDFAHETTRDAGKTYDTRTGELSIAPTAPSATPAEAVA